MSHRRSLRQEQPFHMPDPERKWDWGLMRGPGLQEDTGKVVGAL